MASIRDLLNPLPGLSHAPPSQPMPRSPSPAASGMSSSVPERKVKLPKDAAVFRAGKTQGVVRYPPCEDRDQQLAQIHRQYKLHPMKGIAQYPRNIPYQSDKKTFQERTGRESFQVFQYTFQIPGEETVWTIMWDYNIGLVRTTHLFKCNAYSKTAPGKVLNANPGLRDICHSITGGALAAQGYWMPYDAARAVAATFCWKIRHVLTPLFGTDFPSICVPPEDKEHFGRMVIDLAIVEKARETADLYRSLELKDEKASPKKAALATSASMVHEKRGQEVLNLNDTEDLRPTRQIYPKINRRNYADSVGSARDSSLEPYCNSPHSPVYNSFTPVNGPRSSGTVSQRQVASSEEILACVTRCRQAKNNGTVDSESETDLSSNSQSDSLSFGADENTALNDVDGSDMLGSGAISDSDMDDSLDDDDDNDEDYREPNRRPDGKAKKNPSRSTRARLGDRAPVLASFAREVKAAHALLHLHMQEAEANGLDDESINDVAWGPPLGKALLNGPQGDHKRRASL
ncbi:apses transcription factor Xbp1 [Penicillium hispanicum]|uniref:apses transcription factor Xbp1 n=1 Tax=Penicillium hispanicum TaxID=1080232 RepID=UPI0025417A16|nr:apses transcription factor Xbp1 [Penicillium hispanicum]KAJ5593851.1 apses transcription factor Xbp1 [Penicillium hispanicum]